MASDDISLPWAKQESESIRLEALRAHITMHLARVKKLKVVEHPYFKLRPQVGYLPEFTDPNGPTLPVEGSILMVNPAALLRFLGLDPKLACDEATSGEYVRLCQKLLAGCGENLKSVHIRLQDAVEGGRIKLNKAAFRDEPRQKKEGELVVYRLPMSVLFVTFRGATNMWYETFATNDLLDLASGCLLIATDSVISHGIHYRDYHWQPTLSLWGTDMCRQEWEARKWLQRRICLQPSADFKGYELIDQSMSRSKAEDEDALSVEDRERLLSRYEHIEGLTLLVPTNKRTMAPYSYREWCEQFDMDPRYLTVDAVAGTWRYLNADTAVELKFGEYYVSKGNHRSGNHPLTVLLLSPSERKLIDDISERFCEVIEDAYCFGY